jgi:two-component system nitrogen regulation sensor histidine kinase NtrY
LWSAAFLFGCSPGPQESKLGLYFAELVVWWLLALGLHAQTVHPLQTLANVVAALREEDYSFRARGAIADDALGELSLEVNALADLLADQRIRAIEATALLRRVVEEIDAPLFAFDPDRVLQLVNPAGEKILQQAAVRLLGRTADEIGLADCLNAANEALVALPADSSNARWLVRKSTFRERGVPHTLVVLSDVSRALREEERSAWQRLIRVLGHELNNSLAPIKSIAGSLGSRSGDRTRFRRASRLRTGSGHHRRAYASLNRFLQAYRLGADAASRKNKSHAAPDRGTGGFLETRLAVSISRGPDVMLTVDADQIEQMLINLVRNAVEAALEPSLGNDHSGSSKDGGEVRKPEVTLNWVVEDQSVILTIEDNGLGLLNPSNAFVPFYTTKPSGSGIGLALSRQIVEAHGGSIELSNLNGKRGCQVRVRLPCS